MTASGEVAGVVVEDFCGNVAPTRVIVDQEGGSDTGKCDTIPASINPETAQKKCIQLHDFLLFYPVL